MITYLVSGDADIEPTSTNLRESGRTVRQGDEVERLAPDALGAGGRFVVVAHGNEQGTVYWVRRVEDERQEWVWVGMDPAPHGSRVYFYCCKAGPEISRFLRECDCLGHCDIVPMPVGDDVRLVLSFLDQVDRLMTEEHFDAGRWRAELSKFVNVNFDRELDNPTSDRAPCLWLMLSKSLRAGP